MQTLEARFETVVEVACDIRDSKRRVDGIAREIERNDLAVPRSTAKRLGDMSVALGRMREALKREHPSDNGVLPLLESIAGKDMPLELAGIVGAERQRAKALGQRVADLGRAIGDVQLRISGALRDLSERSIDSLVLAALAISPARRVDLVHRLRDVMNEVATAKADWRLSMGAAVTFQAPDSVGQEDIDSALRRLRATGDVRRPLHPWGRYALMED